MVILSSLTTSTHYRFRAIHLGSTLGTAIKLSPIALVMPLILGALASDIMADPSHA